MNLKIFKNLKVVCCFFIPIDYITMKTNWTETCLSQQFFSNENCDYLQKEMIEGIYRLSNGRQVIKKQSATQLNIIMRSIFLQYCQHLPYDIKGQIQHLNKRVLDYCIDNIYTNIKRNEDYKKEQEIGPTQLMDHPQNMSRSGTKSLMFNPF